MILLKGCDVSIVDGHADDDDIFISKSIYMRYDRTHANLIVRNHGKERYHRRSGIHLHILKHDVSRIVP